MNTAEELLNLIETVDANDTASLEEINARVQCYVENRDADDHYEAPWRPVKERRDNTPLWKVIEARTYATSRDAIKAIRPVNWSFHCHPHYCDAYSKAHGINRTSPPSMPTEELAELHATIQAIQYERDVTKTVK